MEVAEKYLQVPLPEDYIDRLGKRATENDRVLSREGARIIKDVLDGRYEPVIESGLKAAAPIPVENGGDLAAAPIENGGDVDAGDPAEDAGDVDAGDPAEDAGAPKEEGVAA